MQTRREALKFGLKAISLVLAGGFMWSTQTSLKAQTLLIRPPGALDENKFLAECVRCGLCVEACPWHTLKLADLKDGLPYGTPFFTPREIPCYMCTDIPCTVACPTGALDPVLVSNDDGKLNINKAKMGIAVLDPNFCIAYEGLRCDACYRACPVIDKALKLDYRHNDRTQKHAMLIPVVDANYCTGCGMCEQVCVTPKPSIFVLPLALGLGSSNEQYVKGWIADDEKKLRDVAPKEFKQDSKKLDDYLNSDKEL
ncbi:ferredoxin-type protein NapG [Campylobacter suis]|uniref:Ferredoxin-type protein NapG n=1 Tax=Campylobacter suis TaxID=2790657 RepID=A0ABM8Q8M1_9BACT|nr:ferredoxin-type protein NapG [Campylobacter suis]CAD7289174.1 Ferredoxin-type protein NapG [Campylobacter suis]